MDKALNDLRVAADGLKAVATGLHVQLDLSAFDKALAAVLAEKKPVDKPVAKPAQA